MNKEDDETIDLATATLIAAMRQSFEGLLASTLTEVSGDVTAYRQLLAQEFAKHLFRAQAGDERAERSLKYLRMQPMLIAAKRGLAIGREAIMRVTETLLTAVEFGVGVLLAMK